MHIAIIDTINQDVGLKIIFPEADYYTIVDQFDRSIYYQRYCFENSNDIDKINDKRYNTLFVICPLYNTMKTYNDKINTSYNQEFDESFQKVIQIINDNLGFANVCIFDNYDYDYDPNIIYQHHNILRSNITFFKRNYSKNKLYFTNVFSFPYIIFGYQCNIDMLQHRHVCFENKIDRLFFAGSIFTHTDDTYEIRRDRNYAIQKISAVLPPGLLCIANYEYTKYIYEMCSSKFCLDLLGCGDPNIRTFEILSSRTLRIAQRSQLQWNFHDDFCEETYFDDEIDLMTKLLRLMQDAELYQRCLNKQEEIIDKYMNANYMRKYIENICDLEVKRIVLVTSVINISNNPLSYTNTRSVYSSIERFEQTKNTIQSIKRNIPNAQIFLLECTELTDEQTDYFLHNADYFVNITDTNATDRELLLNNINSTSKALGESTLTKFALEYLQRNKIAFDCFIKLSGRYWINHHFIPEWFNKHNIVASPASQEQDKLCTSFYKLDHKSANLWRDFLENAMNKFHYIHNEGFEKIFGDFIASLQSVENPLLVKTIGVSGFVAVDGSYNEW